MLYPLPRRPHCLWHILANPCRAPFANEFKNPGAKSMRRLFKLMLIAVFFHVTFPFCSAAQDGHAQTLIDGAYNTKLVSRDQAPKSWEDLLDPKWKERSLSMKRTTLWYGALAQKWGRAKPNATCVR